MLLNQISKEALLRELATDVDWLRNRLGLWKKYAKQLKSKAIKPNSVLGWSKYTTPSDNVAHMCIIKNEYGGVPTLDYLFLFEYKGGYVQPIFQNGDVKCCIHYTKHSTERVEERSGVCFRKAFEVASTTDIAFVDYSDYGHNGKEILRYFCKGFLICDYEADLGMIHAITYVNKEQAYSNQLKSMLSSKIREDEQFKNHMNKNEQKIKSLPRNIRKQLYSRL